MICASLQFPHSFRRLRANSKRLPGLDPTISLLPVEMFAEAGTNQRPLRLEERREAEHRRRADYTHTSGRNSREPSAFTFSQLTQTRGEESRAAAGREKSSTAERRREEVSERTGEAEGQ